MRFLMALSPVVAGFFAFWLFAIVFLGLLATLVGTL